MEDVEIREARLADYESWRAVYTEVAAEAMWIGGEEAPADDVMRQRFVQSVESPDILMVVADPGAGLGVVGGLSCDFARRGVGHVGMQLLGGWRGRGLGGRLLATCVDWCRAKSAHKVSLEVWPHNGRAIALYRRFGFEVEGRLRRHYRRRNGELWDCLVMGLVLDQESPGSPHPDTT